MTYRNQVSKGNFINRAKAAVKNWFSGIRNMNKPVTKPYKTTDSPKPSTPIAENKLVAMASKDRRRQKRTGRAWRNRNNPYTGSWMRPIRPAA